MMIGFLPGIGGPEWIVLFVVILIVFGPRRLPGIAREAGRVLEQVRRVARDFRDQLMRGEGEDGGGATGNPSPAARPRRRLPGSEPDASAPERPEPPSSGGDPYAG